MIVEERLSFKDRLKQLREQAGLSQYRLAQLSGLKKQTLSHLEKGTNQPGWDTVQKLAKALGVSVEAFIVSEPASEQVQPEQPAPPVISKWK